jgi:hypothetical protein
MSDECFIDRLKMEEHKLSLSVDKYGSLIESPTFDTLPDAERLDLTNQLFHMKEYLAILTSRRIRACGN